MKSNANSDVSRLEDSACRSALRWGGFSAAAICKRSDLLVSDRLTFAALRDSTDFPAAPFVTGAQVGQPHALLFAFRTSDLWAEWCRMVDEGFSTPGHRVMIAKSIGWDLVAITDYKRDCDGNHVVLYGPDHTRLRMQLFHDWLNMLPWSVDRSRDNEEE